MYMHYKIKSSINLTRLAWYRVNLEVVNVLNYVIMMLLMISMARLVIWYLALHNFDHIYIQMSRLTHNSRYLIIEILKIFRILINRSAPISLCIDEVS